MIDEIRLHLSARRPSGQDDADPTIAAALARAAQDPQLQAWAESEKRSDAALTAKLREVPPPLGLRETILAGALASGRTGRRRWWQWFEEKAWFGLRNSELAAVAAVVLLLVSALGWNYLTGTKPDSNWQSFAVAQVSRIENNDLPVAYVINSMPEINQWLDDQSCPAPSELPPAMRKLRIYGCTKIMWGGEPMSIVCFVTGGREIHLVTVSRRNVAAAPPDGSPVFTIIKGYTTASWSEGGRCMMLIGKVGEDELRKLMGAPTVAWAGYRIVAPY